MMFRRFFLFFLVNILVLVTISIVTRLFGLQPYITAQGINYQSLMIFCLMWGMGGSFISLMLSKWMAKSMMGVQIVDSSGPYRELISMVHQMSKQAGIEKMPEVGVYESPDINAFATGPSKNNSLVAVSTGLLQRLGTEEVRGVIGHEVAHVANGDMVTMTLVQGVLNAFVMFFARVATMVVDNMLRGDDDEGGGLGMFAHYAVVMAFEMFFGFLSMFVIAGFSRWREFRADEGGAKLAGRGSMISALEALQQNLSLPAGDSPKGMQYMQISNKPKVMELLSSHPPLEKRIAALKRRI